MPPGREEPEENLVVGHTVVELMRYPCAGRNPFSLDARNQESESGQFLLNVGSPIAHAGHRGGVVRNVGKEIGENGGRPARDDDMIGVDPFAVDAHAISLLNLLHLLDFATNHVGL